MTVELNEREIFLVCDALIHRAVRLEDRASDIMLQGREEVANKIMKQSVEYADVARKFKEREEIGQ